jgi:hypothetical protein
LDEIPIDNGEQPIFECMFKKYFSSPIFLLENWNVGVRWMKLSGVWYLTHAYKQFDFNFPFIR